MLESGTQYLTRAHSDQHQKWFDETAKGAAHWAGTGPAGTTCRECIFMFPEGARSRREAGALLSRTCGKRERLTGVRATVVPHDMPSCRFFAPNSNAPAAQVTPRKRKEPVRRVPE